MTLSGAVHTDQNPVLPYIAMEDSASLATAYEASDSMTPDTPDEPILKWSSRDDTVNSEIIDPTSHTSPLEVKACTANTGKIEVPELPSPQTSVGTVHAEPQVHNRMIEADSPFTVAKHSRRSLFGSVIGLLGFGGSG